MIEDVFDANQGRETTLYDRQKMHIGRLESYGG
jgi:hypothetical protein